MKKKTKELNVDYIGGQGPLTKEEELAISAFIRKNKEKLKSKKLSGKSKIKNKTLQFV
ncbi:MAG: hypothetical protein K2Q24_03725 [Chitinophagaceae bacterium]|nr:hypothetical protein [Chitinophagaceae bacterium]